jgi:hypothetical protein
MRKKLLNTQTALLGWSFTRVVAELEEDNTSDLGRKPV